MTRLRSTNACNPVDKPTRNNGDDKFIYFLKTRFNSQNQLGDGSSNPVPVQISLRSIASNCVPECN